MSTEPEGRRQVRQNFDHERVCQPFMDADYRGRGYLVRSRAGTREYDVILMRSLREVERVEEKFRDKAYDDLLVELVQDISTGDLGWFYHTRCDFLHYAICPNWAYVAYYWRIAWVPFKAWFLDTYFVNKRYLKAQTSVQGYGKTLNICVLLQDIPDSVKQRYQVASIGLPN